MAGKSAYLDVSREEAIRRYKEDNECAEVEENQIKEFKFTDEFRVYDAWSIEPVKNS